MKHIPIIIALLVASISVATAQRSKIKEKINALRVATFTEVLDLDAKEAQQFWPIFNEFDLKITAIHKELRALEKTDIEGKSDKEIEQLIEKRFALQEKKLATERAYFSKFKEVLPLSKVAKISTAQRKFKLELVKRTREMRRKKR